MSISGDLPPLVLELRAKASELYATLGKVKGDVMATTSSTGSNMEKMAAKTEGATTSMSSRLQSVGSHATKALGIASLGAAAIGYESLKSAVDFQKSTTLLVTAGGEAKSNLASVQQGIQQIAMATGENTQQLSDAMYTVEKSGNHGAAGLKILKAAAQSAMAEGSDLPTMTNALTSAMMSYGKNAGDAATMASQMDKAAGLSKTTMQAFAGSLSTVLPIASAAGVNFAQVGGAIATLTQHGTSADEATQELANTIRNLQAPNQVAQKAMQQLGLNVNDVSTKLGQRGLTGTIALITDAVKSHLGPAGTEVVNSFQQQASATQDLQVMLAKMPPSLAAQSKAFMDGKESYAEYNKAAKSLGGPQYEMAKQFMSLQSKAQGFNNILRAGSPAQQTAAKQLKDMLGGSTGLNTALMLSGHNAGYFNSAVEQISSKTGKANGDISNWAETQSTLAVQLDKAKQHVAVLGQQIGEKLIPIVETVLDVVSKVFKWLGDHKAVLITLAAIFGVVLVGAIGAAVAAWVSASVAFVASPLGLIVLAVIALIAGIVMLVMHWQQVWNFIKRITAVVVNFLKGLWNDLVGAFKAVLDAVKKAAEAAWNWVKGITEKVWGAIKSFFTGLWNDIVSIFNDAVNGVKRFLSDAWNFIKDTAATVWNTIKMVIVTPVEDVASTIGRIVGDIKNAFATAWGDITSAAQTAWNLFRQYVIKPVQDLWSDIQTIVGKFTGFFQGVWDSITSAATSVWDGITSTVQSAMSSVGSVVAAVINGVIDAINAVINVINGITGGISDLWKWSGIPGIPAIPDIPLVSFAEGGIVKATPGGILAQIGEAGHDEAVIPLDGKHGLGMGVGGTTTVVNVTVQGSVVTEQDLVQTIRTQFLRLGARHGGVDTYQGFRR